MDYNFIYLKFTYIQICNVLTKQTKINVDVYINYIDLYDKKWHYNLL